jgi:hypothetical protein
MKIKRLAAIALALILALSLAACGGVISGAPGGTTDNSTDKPEKSDTVELGELTLLIDGEVVTLPLTVDEFADLGWAPRDDKEMELMDKTLEPKQFANILFRKDNLYAYAFVANMSDDQSINVSEGTILGFDYVEASTYELPNGIVQGVATRDDIIAAYGEPAPSNSDSFMYYTIEGFYVNLYIDDDDVLASAYIIFSGHSGYEHIEL